MKPITLGFQPLGYCLSAGEMPDIRSFYTIGLFVVFFFLAGILPAATITVTNFGDSGPGTLRQAIAGASPGDVIKFSGSGTITLTSGEIGINNAVTIDGAPYDVILSGNNSSRIFFVVAATTLRNLTLQNGTSSDYFGGAIFSQGILNAVNCVFRNNFAVNAGAVTAAYGNSNFVNCQFLLNESSSQAGALYTQDNTVTVTNCLFYDNYCGSLGGAIMVGSNSSVTVTGSTIVENSAGSTGGGIYNGSSLRISNSIAYGNNALSGPDLRNAATLLTSSFNLIGDPTGSGLIIGTSRNISSDPQFVDPSALDFRLQANSPASASGYPSYLPQDVTDADGDGNTTEKLDIDLAGKPRVAASSIDMGAYQIQFGDLLVTNGNDSGVGSLRAAMELANGNPGPDLIRFSISPPYIIQVNSNLPQINDDGLVIDATLNIIYEDTPKPFVVVGEGASRSVGLDVRANYCKIKGLILKGFPFGTGIKANNVTGLNVEENVIFDGKSFFEIELNQVTASRIAHNKIGLNESGERAEQGIVVVQLNASSGITISDNIIASPDPETNQILSAAVKLHNNSANNFLINNYIGTDEAGNDYSGYGGISISESFNNEVRSNTIAFHNLGISGANNLNSTVAVDNQFVSNEFICILEKSIKLVNEANGGILPPVITEATTSRISGTASPFSRIEIYFNRDENDCGGPPQQGLFQGFVWSNASGNWSYLLSSPVTDQPVVSATQTLSKSTSEFSDFKIVGAPLCTELISPSPLGVEGVSIDADLEWAPAATAIGYRITIGTTEGGGDIINDLDVGNVTTYDPGTLPLNTTIYVKITPYSESPNLTCPSVASFSTADPALCDTFCGGICSYSCDPNTIEDGLLAFCNCELDGSTVQVSCEDDLSDEALQARFPVNYSFYACPSDEMFGCKFKRRRRPPPAVEEIRNKPISDGALKNNPASTICYYLDIIYNDYCFGHDDSLILTLEVVDDQAPSFTAPADITVNCGANIQDLNVTGKVLDAFDNCTIDTIFYSDVPSGPENCNTLRTVLRTWTVRDNCGLETSKVQTITVEPIFGLPCREACTLVNSCEFGALNCGDVLRFSCSDPALFSDSALAGRITACFSGACGSAPWPAMIRQRLWAGSGITPNCITGSCAVYRDQLSWQFGNETFYLILEAIDDQPPGFIVPPDRVIACGALNDPQVTGEPTGVFDNCGIAWVNHEDDIQPDDCDREWRVTRTWSIADHAGTITAKTQLLIVLPEVCDIKGDGAIPEGEIPTGDYSGEGILTANGTVATGSSVKAFAGEKVVLQPGFQVNSGADFSAWIKACYGDAPENDLCNGAIEIFCGDDIIGSNVNATRSEVALLDLCGFIEEAPGYGKGVWYRYEGTGERIQVDVKDADPAKDLKPKELDTHLRVYTGDCGNLVCIGGNEDFQSTDLATIRKNPNSRFTFQSEPGKTYYIYVEGRDNPYYQSFYSSEGEFRLTVSCVNAVGGLKATYYNNIDFTDKAFQRIDPTVDFDWGEIDDPDVTLDKELFSVIWEGYVKPEFTETYTFYTTVDDGVRLWVDNQLLIDQWVDQAVTEWSGTIPLTAGDRVPIRMEYYENMFHAVAKLSWSSPTQQKEIIPREQLIPAGFLADCNWQPASSHDGIRTIRYGNNGLYFYLTPGNGLSFCDDFDFVGDFYDLNNSLPSRRFYLGFVGTPQCEVCDAIMANLRTSDPQVDQSLGKERTGSISSLQLIPNPFRTSAVIRYSLPEASTVSLYLFDLTGKALRVLVDQSRQDRGDYQIALENTAYPSGVYVLRLQTERGTEVRKVVIE